MPGLFRPTKKSAPAAAPGTQSPAEDTLPNRNVTTGLAAAAGSHLAGARSPLAGAISTLGAARSPRRDANSPLGAARSDLNAAQADRKGAGSGLAGALSTVAAARRTTLPGKSRTVTKRKQASRTPKFSKDNRTASPLAGVGRAPYENGMRTIGNLESEQSASRFSSTLYSKGIENQIENEEDGQYSVWVIEEEQLAQAAELLKRFRANPGAAEFIRAESLAEEQRERKKESETAKRSTVADAARVGYERQFTTTPYVPIALIIISIAVAIYTQFGSDVRSLKGLLFADLGPWHVEGLASSFAQVRAGQLWRLVTPAFIHFGIPHLLFNAMMLYDLGSFIERRFGPRYLLWLFLALAICSNVGQVLWKGPTFGGLSGVDYGLFGFLWIRGKFDRTAGWELNKNTVTLLIVWLLLGYSGLLKDMIGNVANGAHTVGLVAGMGWGWLSAKKN